MAVIPREVWRFCVDQVKLYPLNAIAYNNQISEARTVYLESGMSGPHDQSGVITHSGAAPQVSRFEAQENILHSPNFRYLSKCVSIMELVQKDPDISPVLDAIWDCGWRDNTLIAKEVEASPATVKRCKHEIIRRIAAGWGLW